MPHLVLDQGQVQHQGMRGDLGVHVAYGLPAVVQEGSDFSVTVGRLCSPWQHWKFMEQQVYGAPPLYAKPDATPPNKSPSTISTPANSACKAR